MIKQRHPALTSYLARSGTLVPDRPDGAVVLVFDALYRLYLWPVKNGELMLEHRLTPLPPTTRECDEMIEHAAASAALRLARQMESIALSEDGRQLLLQQRIGADASPEQFEAALENFLNAIADWRLILRVN